MTEARPAVDLFGNEVTETKLIDRTILGTILSRALSGLSLDEFAGLFVNEVSAALEFADLCNGRTGACNNVSLLWNPHRLATARQGEKPIYQSLTDPTYCDGLARAMLHQHGQGATDPLLQGIALGANGRGYVYDFQPSIAVAYYKWGTQSRRPRILDPCAGWGGRMLGAAAVGAHYVGYEPSERTHRGLVRMAEWLETFNTGFSWSLIDQPYEDSRGANLTGYFDMALTSPPYYDTELYADEATQSYMRYDSYDLWRDHFYYPLVDLTMPRLKPGGVFVLNVADRKYPLSTDLLRHWPLAREVSVRLTASSGGLGRDASKRERFYALFADDTAQPRERPETR